MIFDLRFHEWRPFADFREADITAVNSSASFTSGLTSVSGMSRDSTIVSIPYALSSVSSSTFPSFEIEN
jgi:hypothetical protein